MSLRRPSILVALLALVASLLATSPALSIPAAAASCSGAPVVHEDFEDATVTYTPSVAEFSDLAGDFFTRTDGSNVGGFYEIAGVQGTSYFAAMDTDGDGQPAVLTLDWTGLDVTGMTGLEFCGLFAEDDDGTNQDWDPDSSVLVQAQLDGGGYDTVLAFESTGDTNTEPALDTDFDGVGDGTALTATLTQFAAGIPGTGSTLDLRIMISNLDAGDEDIAFDNVVVTDGASPVVPELLLTEVVVTPTAAEFIEIHNPGGASVDLSDVYLTDATFAGGGTYYYNVVTGTNAGGGSFSDFHARFPDGASIGAGEYQTVALAGSDDFFAAFASNPTYELFEDGASADSVPDMREAFAGSINNQGGLTNGGEVAVLYHWDGDSDLVTDLDYVLWGDTAEAVDKTGVAIDGPDADTDATTYLDDTAIANQVIVDTGHSDGSSFQRVDLDEGTETMSGGNGALGHDETSEDLDQTWAIATSTPGAAAPTGGGGGTPAIVLIHEIQGASDTPPLPNDTRVQIEAIVVGDFQGGSAAGGDGNLGGFFVQEEDLQADGDPDTSEGIFVWQGSFGDPAVDVAVGDLVTVEADVNERFGDTQLDNATVTVQSSGNPLPSAATVTLPLDTADALEAVEGMRVQMAQELFVTEYFNLDRFGEVLLASGAPHRHPNQDNLPGSTGSNDTAAQNLLNEVMLDDGSGIQNPEPVPFVEDPSVTPYTDNIRRGQSVTGLTAFVRYATGSGSSGEERHRLMVHPDQLTFEDSDRVRPVTPPAVGGDITVASFNVLNFFETIDDGVNDICGPAGDQECRGADSADELDRQLDKTVQALIDLDADVVGLIEIENDTDNTAVQLLVDELNAVLGAGTWAQVETGAIGTDAIRQAFVYRPAAVTPVGAFAVLDTADFVAPLTPGDPKNRPALAQTFTTPGGGRFTAVINHLKSKGSGCGAGDDDLVTFQGNCNGTRTAAAQELVDWLATDPTGSGDPDVLVLGDLNAYGMEDPIRTIEDAGYTNLAGTATYGYVFDGAEGTLDYALANASLASQVTGAAEWHINADEADLIDYNTDFGRNPGYFNGDIPFRASDHDPVVVGLDLDEPSTGGGGNPGTPTEEPTEPPTGDRSIREQCDDDATCTSVTVSQQTFVDGARSLFQQVVPAAVATEALLASDTVFADALASGALQDTRPLLLNDPDALEDEVLAEIQRLGVGAVWILGGVDAVGQDVEDALVAEGLDVRRIAGPTRLETAQAVAELVGTAQPLLARAFPGDGDATQAFADSLAAGGWAAGGDRSVLLSQTEVLSDSTAAHLEASIASEATLVGGPAALADAVLDAVRDLGFTSDRVAGANRFDTAARIATERGFGDDRRADVVIISEGQADDAWEGGFTAAAPAAVFDAPILLANGDDLPPETLAALADMVEADAEVMCLASSAACEAAVEAIG
ncbi:ExeM/NucH family extracellular endonuclease [Euzebya rosea]|uniref:ExeM/NucH family extracellular endonuclease n=1 Tax=Euzebya rosea TaxID=2052804 RepID=UPI001475AB7A|nr:ExeM/NucH family extracellular endonuclease [Euzebya rosea]